MSEGHTSDWDKDDPEAQASDAPTGKESTTEADEGLDEDQLAFQTDSS